ncbi:MAG: helix-turn-helix transcriptional regulator [Alphaproteobacteria bacterium]|nr:helix-turn-helix transcriptional regulator [Alphaproteobacteria bacterium]
MAGQIDLRVGPQDFEGVFIHHAASLGGEKSFVKTKDRRCAVSGLTQEQLAERCGVGQQCARGLEKGKRNPPPMILSLSKGTLYVIARGSA